MPTTLTNGIQLPDKGSVDWYSSMQSNYNLIDTHLGDTDAHVTAEDKANWNSKQGSLSQAQLDAIAQVATNTDDIATLQSDKADASHTHSSSDITDIGDYATKQYVDNSISGLVDNAPAALDTLNELSAALNDDANFASTVTTALSAKADSADLATVATSGDYNDLDNLPTIPTKTSDLSNDSDFVVSSNLATIATSGDYDDLSNKPSIPTNTSDLNNDSGFVTLNDFDIPAKTSDLTNDSGFITSSDVPTSTSDLINDSNFVDTSNSAVASGITSAKVTDYDTHIADTDIHVTASDKTTWNTVSSKAQDSDVVHKSGDETINGVKSFIDYFLGKDLSGQTVDLNDCVDAYGGAIHYYYAVSNYSNISNKPENKPFILESKTVRYVSSIDYIYYQKIYTTDYNAPPSIYTRYYRSGSASWSNWIKDTDKFVTTDTDQTIGGIKSFSNDIIRGYTTISSRTIKGFGYSDTTGLNGNGYIQLQANLIYNDSTPSRQVTVTLEILENAYADGRKSSFSPNSNNTTNLGKSGKRWGSVYATNYYYGSSETEFSTKFVTTDTAQTISGSKTFSSNVNVYNSDSATDTANIVLKNSKAERGVESPEQSINFIDKNNNFLAKISCNIDNNNSTRLYITAYDINNNSDGFFLRRTTSGTSIIPTISSTIWLGNISAPFYNVQTKKINTLEPSSLSLPSDRSARIDISSYITNLGNGDNNQYIVPANGYIWLHFTSINSALCYSQTSGGLTNYAQTFVRYQGDGQLYAFFPVRKNDYFIVQIYTASTAVVQNAYFIPCQGNI